MAGRTSAAGAYGVLRVLGSDPCPGADAPGRALRSPRPPRPSPGRTRTLRGDGFSSCARDRVRRDGPKHSSRSAGIAERPFARCLHGDRRGRAAGGGGAGWVPESALEWRKPAACQPACKTRRDARHQQGEPAEKPGHVPRRGPPERVERGLEITGEKRSQRLRAVDLVEGRRRRAGHCSRVTLGRRDVDGQSARRA